MIIMTVEPPIEERLRLKRTDARWIVEYPGPKVVPPPAADAGCRDVDERPHGNTHDEGCANSGLSGADSSWNDIARNGEDDGVGG